VKKNQAKRLISKKPPRIALTPDDGGYWMAGTDGHVYAFGDAQVWAEPAALPANLPVAAIAGT